MKLRLKLILPIILITAVMAVLTVYLITDDLEQDALIRAQQVTAEYIIAKARERLTPENFQDADFQRQKPVFEAFLNLVKTPEILKIKVFDAKFNIIYSTKAEDIGRKTDSTNYRKSLLEGKIAASIKPPVDETTNIELMGYRQLMEIYVPISYANRTEGVVEVYFKMDAINQAIKDTSTKVVGLIVLFALVVCVAMYAFLTAMVVRPLKRLKGAADKIVAGQTDVSLPYLSTRDEIGALRETLKNVLETMESVKKKWG